MEKELRLRIHSGSGKWSTISGEDNLGFELEHNATSIVIELPKEVHGGRHFVEFIKPSGVVVSSAPLEETTDESGIHSISIGATSGLLNESGRYYLQYVGVKGEQDPKTFKSELKALDVEYSVNAGIHIEESDEDFIRWATREIAQLRSAMNLNDSKDLEQDEKDSEIDETNEGQNEAIENLKSQIRSLEAILASSVYSGVIFYGSATTGIRVGAASGKTLEEIRKLPVFRTIKHGIDSVDGHSKWSVNKFYVKHVSAEKDGYVPGDAEWFEGWYVAESKIDDSWKLLPAFSKLGKEKIVLGKYDAGVEGDDEETGVLVTKPNLSPVNNYSPETARSHLPSGARSMHFFEAQAIDILMWVSTGVRDLQREFYMGACFDPCFFYPCDNTWCNERVSNKARQSMSDLRECTAFQNMTDDEILACFAPGTQMTLWDDNDSIAFDSVTVTGAQIVTMHNEDDDEDVELIELTFNKQVEWWDRDDGYYVNIMNTIFKTGMTDSVEGETGEETTSINGCRHFKWYGLEDWYGCVYEWLEGVALVGIYDENLNTNSKTKTHVKYCIDPEYYAEANYQDGNAGAMSHWVSALNFDNKNGGYVEEYKETSLEGFYIPYSENGEADDATFYADDANVNTIRANSSYPVQSCLFCRGSTYGDEWYAGPSRVSGDDSTDTNGNIGFRLSYDEYNE